ncbi:hypothetical protein V7S43_011067 [Phytophthora oleae]|uniref:Uncharacterized protein n=1 Tax=Phytophthora oleae TaxID=2107226 RepID=A0ABD3FCK4_9STRA
MPEKRQCVQTTKGERVKKFKIWQQHPEWTPTQAAEKLGVKKGTLMGWRKELLDPKLTVIRKPSSDS